MNVLLVILAAVLVFGSVIFIHELGHFIVAKKSGIKVNEFAMGMGPTLFKKKKGETTYALRLLPIGGFVAMEGEDEESENPRSFNRAPAYKRFLVIIAGAFMNFVLGFVVLALLTAVGGQIASRTISVLYNEDTGLHVGDVITHVNGRRAFIINDISYEFARTQNGTFDLTVKRDGQKVQLTGVEFEVVTAYDEETGEVVLDETGEPYQYLNAGFAVQPVEKNILTVARQALYTTASYARLIYRSVFDMITGRVAINQLSGPVGIVSQISQAVSIGWSYVFNILAIITINLGIVNMLPFPALDGGRAVLIVLEKIRRKPLKQKYEAALNLAGFAVLMALIVLVSFNDIARLIG